MSTMKNSLAHLKTHVKYPTDKKALVATCNNMSDVPQEDRDWFAKTVPEGNYKGPTDVMNALIARV